MSENWMGTGELNLIYLISLGRPEIFEKVAKIGVGCIFGSYKSPN